MRLGLLSDVHANLQALRTVLDRLERERVDRLVCLGDVVGYGGDPEACVALIRERVNLCIRGNHEAAALESGVRRTFTSAALVAINAHAKWLHPNDTAYLAKLPQAARITAGGPQGSGLFVIHGTPGEVIRFTYLLTPAQAAQAFQYFPERFGAVGHTHVPAMFERDDGGGRTVRERDLRPDGWQPPPRRRGFRIWREESRAQAVRVDTRVWQQEGIRDVTVAPGWRAILNPGSVGQPRDGDPRAACMVLDLPTGRAYQLRLPYDIEAAQARIRERGLPEQLAARLAVGI
jgi:predicted phosphodiesterase